MGISNEELVNLVIQKAITSGLLSSYGKMNPKQFARFLDFVIDVTALGKYARTEKFNNEKLQIDKLSIGSRVMRAGTEYVAPQHRSRVSTSQIELQPKEAVACFDITDRFKNINLEGENVGDHIMQLFAKGWGNNSELLAINGDTVGQATLESVIEDGGSTTQYVKDNLLFMFDGWLRKADSGHLFDAENANIGLNIFSQAMMALPEKFRLNPADLRFIMSPNLALTWLTKFATRMTPEGDNSAMGKQQTPLGVPIIPVPQLPYEPTVVQHVTLDDVTPVSLRYAPVSSVVVLPTTLSDTPTTPYTSGASGGYILDATAGTLLAYDNGSGLDGATVKVTYKAQPQLLLTHMSNLILAHNEDSMKVERGRNIHKRADEVVMSGYIDVQIEEVDALVKVYNIGKSV